MLQNKRNVFLGGAICAILLAMASSSPAATIIKLNLGDTGPDVQMAVAGGTLATMSDGNGATTGDQNTAVEYTDFMDGLFSDINTSTASFSLGGLATSGSASVFGSLVIQNYAPGATFNLYDPSNTLLLSGTLGSAALAGNLGPPGVGGLFTTTVSTVTGGSLSSYIVPTSLVLSMNLSNINGGAGLAVVADVLQPFTADALVGIEGTENIIVPEPALSSLLVLAAVAAVFVGKQRS
ncbi:MAG: hypothetical protein IT425_08670 [Pirellulales bacterium]|nr:hypothetical protein [Pirellulales bacterium]